MARQMAGEVFYVDDGFYICLLTYLLLEGPFNSMHEEVRDRTIGSPCHLDSVGQRQLLGLSCWCLYLPIQLTGPSVCLFEMGSRGFQAAIRLGN